MHILYNNNNNNDNNSRGRRSFKTVSTNRVIFPLDDLNCSISAGYGWGIVHILLYYSSYVFKSIGPGTYYDNNCSLFSVITKSSFFSFSLFLQNIFLMIIFYDSLSKKSNLQWWFTVFLHLFASLWVYNNILIYYIITIYTIQHTYIIG